MDLYGVQRLPNLPNPSSQNRYIENTLYIGNMKSILYTDNKINKIL